MIPASIKSSAVLKVIVVIVVLAAVVGAVLLTRKHSATQVSAILVLHVPFSPQAPTDNWSRNEDCEETSITMANAYLTGSEEDKLPPEAAQGAINALKDWEQSHLGYNANTGIDATTAMAEGAFHLKINQIRDYTEQDLKTALLANHPVLLAVNARLLGNPKYLDIGPLYHMIVVRGYNETGFIVNDPGTDSGDGNVYTFSALIGAASDWNQTTKMMDPNRKFALIVAK